MSYTYPEALDAMQQIAIDLLRAAGQPDAVVQVVPDAVTGTASVSWNQHLNGRISCTIRMPVLPASYRMSQREFDNYAGFILHEVGHPLYTNWRVWMSSVSLGYGSLVNSLEDVREELETIKANFAANAKEVLTALCHSLDYTAMQKGFDANDPRNIGFVMAFLGRAQNGYALDTRLIKLNPQGAVAKVVKWALPALAACKSTQDCLDLAIKIVGALPAKTKQPKQPEAPKGKGMKGGEGEKDEQAKGEQAKGEQAKGEQGEGSEGEQGEGSEGEQAKGEQAKGEQAKGEAGNGAGEYAEGCLKPEDVRKVDLRPTNGAELKDKRGESAASQMAKIIEMVRESNRKGDRALTKAQPNADVEDQADIGGEALKATRQRALLARALKRNEQDMFEGGLKHGKLDRHAFARLQAGARNVFGRRELTEGYETDVVVLVDGSGSMSERIRDASVMALVVAQAASQVGVACTVYEFGTSCKYGNGTMHGLIEVKQGKGKPDVAKFAEMPHIYGGGTPLSRSMLAIARRQAASAKGKRRIMFVVSDGMCSEGMDTLKATADYVEDALGTELAHMSIHMPVAGCFRNEVMVKWGQPIAQVGLEALTKKLERGA